MWPRPTALGRWRVENSSGQNRIEVELEKGGSRNELHLKHPFDNFLLAQSGSGASGVWFGGKRLAWVFEYHLRDCNRGAIVHNSHTESLFPWKWERIGKDISILRWKGNVTWFMWGEKGVSYKVPSQPTFEGLQHYLPVTLVRNKTWHATLVMDQ